MAHSKLWWFHYFFQTSLPQIIQDPHFWFHASSIIKFGKLLSVRSASNYFFAVIVIVCNPNKDLPFAILDMDIPVHYHSFTPSIHSSNLIYIMRVASKILSHSVISLRFAWEKSTFWEKIQGFFEMFCMENKLLFEKRRMK